MRCNMEEIAVQDILTIEELNIPINFRRQQRKTLAISVTEDAELMIKAPFHMPEQEIQRFLKQRRFWIYKQTKRMIEQNASKPVRSEGEIRALRKRAEEVLWQKTVYYANLLGVSCQGIRIGDQKTFWGSCSSKGRISYNWHLVLMPERIQDYVVVHELCHLMEMNHSVRFWNQVEGMIPDYKERRKWLKEYGNEYR